MSAPKTYSTRHLEKMRSAHAKTDGYGRGKHEYLAGRIQRLAGKLRRQAGTGTLRWLDYGCGKGDLIALVRPLNLFDDITGYDFAVDAFGARPQGTFDLVTCCDVIDIVEPNYQAAVLNDVVGLARGDVLFSCLTLPWQGTLQAHSAFYWRMLVSRYLEVEQVEVECPRMRGFERAVILAAPRAASPPT